MNAMNKFLRLVAISIFVFSIVFSSGCGSSEQQAKQEDPGASESLTQIREADLNAQEPGEVEKEIEDQSNTAILKELAEFEKQQSMTKLHQFIVKCDNLTEQWESGQIVYNKYILDMFELKNEFDSIYNNAETIYKEKDYAAKLKDEKIYTNSLIHGQKLRETVREFFNIAFEATLDSEGKLVDVSGDSYKQLYHDKLIKQYNDSYRALNRGINSI